MLRAKDFEEALTDLLYGGVIYSDDGDVEIKRIIPFESAGLMTNNAGVVIRLSDGSEFQLSINKSR